MQSDNIHSKQEVYIMEPAEFDKLMKEISDKTEKIGFGNLKGHVLHEHLRAITTNLHFKWIEKNEMKIETYLAELEQEIGKHLVTDAEDDISKTVHKIIRDYILLFITVNSILLFEKRDLEDINHLIKDFEKTCETKGISGELVKEITTLMQQGLDEWKAELADIRKMINSVWAKAEGRGGWALTAFSKMHKEGYFVRYQERKRFKDAIRNASKVETTEKQLKKAKSKEAFVKVFTSWFQREETIAKDYKIVAKLLFNTWSHITQEMGTLLQITVNATKIHELPIRDQEQMTQLHNAIISSLQKKYLHALRIDDKQLEAIYSEVQAELNKAKKAAA